MGNPKLGGKPILRIWIQPSSDILSSLFDSPSGRPESGYTLEELVRAKYGDAVRLDFVRGPAVRSDLLAQSVAGGSTPSASGRGQVCPVVKQPEADHNSTLLDDQVDIVVLSAQPELLAVPWSVGERDHLIGPIDSRHQNGSAEPCTRLDAQITPASEISGEESKENWARFIRLVKQASGAHIIVFNCSPLDPTDQVHNYHRTDDTLSVRAQRLNFALMQLSTLEGISIIDVERLVAELGGDQHVLQPLLYSAEAYASMCGEFLRVLEDIGFFETRPLVMQVGRRERG
jgi:hypothetical protein